MKDNKLSLTDTVDVEELKKKIAELINENKSLKKQKKFGLVWEDKPDAQVIRVRNEAPMLREDPSKAVVGDTNDINHILINGDNFHALTALRATHMGKVDVIYIDPPYNTGNTDFIYNDNYLDKEDGYRHSKWLSFMEKRLSLAKELMTDAGVIFVAIDDNEHSHLKLLMDEVFGPDNFLANIVWQGQSNSASKLTSGGVDYMLAYAKQQTNIQEWVESKFGVEEVLSAAASCWNKSGKDAAQATILMKKWWSANGSSYSGGMKAYSKIDAQGRLFRPVTLSAPDKPETRSHRPIIHPTTKKPCKVSSRGWAAADTTIDRWVNEGLVDFGDDETTIPNKKYFLEEQNSQHPTPTFYSPRRSNHLRDILGTQKFSFAKDHKILQRWFEMIAGKDALVLDFFAGSGSTAEAIAELNKKDGGTRQCILVTDGGKTEITGESSKNSKEGAVNIAEEITYERVRRVLTGKDWADGKEHEPLGGNLRYFKVVMEQSPHGATERDQRLTLEKYTIEHAKIAENVFDVVDSKDDFDDETLAAVDYKVFTSGTESRYLVGVNSHDYALSELEAWFASLPMNAEVVMVGNGVEEIGWVKNNSDRIKVDDVLGRTIRSRKYVASKLPLG